ncbi:MAG: ribbon-helix-helix protein, CopG family [Nitrospirae bacterium]|nr:ribbon-helix-helix protein, CopG family [Nitrospirota bacterium]
MLRTRKLISVSLPPAMLKDTEKAAKAEHRTKSELMREALRQYLFQRSLFTLRESIRPNTKGKTYTEEEIAAIVKDYRREQGRKSSRA